MCGIAGVMRQNPKPAIDQLVVQAMTRAIAHRGYDGEGLYADPQGSCVLGHRRLSIIDLSPAAAQPLISTDGRYIITFNGEIYNYRQLAKELDIPATSDTAVILAGFSRWREQLFIRLRGMFALAIWDMIEQTLFLARDHLGVKPLYWSYRNGMLIFASELKGMLAHPAIERRIDQQALLEYAQFYTVHPPKTMLAGVCALPAGSWLTINAQQLRVQSFWSLDHVKPSDQKESVSTIISMVRHLFEQAVERHLVADVDVGLMLSGGLDSTAILAIAHAHFGRHMQTFSIGFDRDGAYLDESSAAARIAQHFGATHHHVQVSGTSITKLFNDFIQAIDQPSGDGMNSFLISREIGSYLKVALSGLGGDELFLGYRYVRELIAYRQWQQSLWGRTLLPALHVGHRSSKLFRSVAYRAGIGFAGIWPARHEEVYLRYRSIRTAPEAHALFAAPGIAQLRRHRQLESFFHHEDYLNGYARAELAWYTAGTLLRDADATGMAATLEVRFPFLDVDLVSSVLAVPSAIKMMTVSNTPKPLLVTALADLWPPNVVTSPKRGFELPLGFWLRNSLTAPVQQLRNHPLLNVAAVDAAIATFTRDPRNYLPVWSLVVLTQWIDQHQLAFDT